MATYPIYQIYVELKDFKPKMWRRFQMICGTYTTLADLAYMVMILYEVRNDYSYEFKRDELKLYLKKHPEYSRHPELLNDLNKEFHKAKYGITSKNNLYMFKDKDYERLQDASKTYMNEILTLKQNTISLFYDPEINWEFDIVLEKILEDKVNAANHYPKVLEGQGYGIIESFSGAKELEKERNTLKKRRWENNIDYKYYSTSKETNKFYFDKLVIEDMDYRVKKMRYLFKLKYERSYKKIESIRIVRIQRRQYRIHKNNDILYRKKSGEEN